MATTSENTASMSDIFARSQQQIMQDWGKALATFQEGLQTMGPSQTNSDNTRQLIKVYDSWKENAGKYLDVLMSACPGNEGIDTYSKVFRAADAYTRLYEVWEPLATALQKQALDVDSYKDALDPAKYAETIQKVFGFGAPTDIPGLHGPASDWLETWGAKSQQFMQPWADAMRTSADAVLAAQSGDPKATMEVFHGLHAAFDRTFGKFLNMPAVGKDRRQVELLSKAIDRYADFLAKNAELQRRIFPIAQQSMERVIHTMAQNVSEDGEVIGFGEFVELWTKTNEAAFLEFFRTEEYAELQGIVLDTALDCRQQFQQLMEVALQDFPIALRSEMDDISKTNYSLKKSVRALKKKCSEIDDMREEIEQLKKKVDSCEKKLAAAKSSGRNAKK